MSPWPRAGQLLARLARAAQMTAHSHVSALRAQPSGAAWVGYLAVAGVLWCVVYLRVFGGGVETAVEVLVSHRAARPLGAVPSGWVADVLRSAVGAVVGSALVAAVIAVPSGLSARDFGLRRVPRGALMGRDVGVFCGYIGVLAVALSLGSAMVGWLGLQQFDYPVAVHPAHSVVAFELLHAAIAGFIEEPLLLAIPMAVATRWRWPWPVTIGVLTVIRLPFHLYYSWGALFVLLWMPAAYLLCRRVVAIVPIVLAHSTYDVLTTAINYHLGGAELALILRDGLAIAGMIFIWVAIGKAAIAALRRRRAATTHDVARGSRD